MSILQSPPLWRQIQRKNFTKWQDLTEFLELNELQKSLTFDDKKFPLNLPLRLAQKISKKNLKDPILRQFVPLVEENDFVEGFVQDPVSDQSFRQAPKLLHKYFGRVLIVAAKACAMHCRYCFRRHFDYACAAPSFDQELQLIEEDSSINEVILSGGDPLSLSNQTLKVLIDRLSSIGHLRKLRFHSRFPIGIPERIDSEFLDLIANCRLQVWFVVHTNHPNELDSDIFHFLKQLQKLGVPVLNQSVLLKGVNDDVDTLAQLFEKLVDFGIFPYYLHQLDKVNGAAHFEVEEERGIEIMRELFLRLPGYAVPKYVREVSGDLSKRVINC